MRAALILAMCGCVSLAEGPAVGDDETPLDCDNAWTQVDMTACAAEDYAVADEALNAQWAVTRRAMVDIDEAIKDPEQRGAEKSLLSAQRAWITYRDGQCDADGWGYFGGTIRPQIVASCLADLTRKRTEELKSMIETSR